ncbi:MAG TPA: peptidoglycan-binding protein [Solirubrobacteraceae bacterium]|nr:peptidoglycan-binding protein [Solirubrobacteraceae bacterium]
MASAYRFGGRTLTKGMQGADVRVLQRDLTAVGIWTFNSGVFSEGTKIHVKRFQQRSHLLADGVVGPQTARVLSRMAKRRLAKAADTSGGEGAGPTASSAPAGKATLNSQGLAVAPAGAPAVIQNVIAAANQIAFKPYVYGGGHASWDSSGYDCSGSVSYALHGGGLLSTPYDSTQFESYGASGFGKWITIYANAGHAYMKIAGLFFDTAAQSTSNGNDRWSTTRISPLSGFVIRHPRNW